MHPDSTDLSDITGTRDKGVGTGRFATVTKKCLSVLVSECLSVSVSE